jgi:hypothetical protein
MDFRDDISVGFSEVGLSEANKIATATIDLYNLLYSNIDNDLGTANKSQGSTSESFHFGRYSSVGYEANYESLDKKEMQQWKAKFTFSRVIGSTLQECEPYQRSDIDITSSNCLRYADEKSGFWDVASSIGTDPRGMFVCGQGYPKIADPQVQDGCEILDIIDGCLEETLECDYSGDVSSWQVNRTHTHDEHELCEDPLHSQRSEVISSFTDALWPEVILSMQPFIERVVLDMPLLDSDEISKPATADDDEVIQEDGAQFSLDNYDW